MKNYCSILQELLRLRQICVHMALVRDSEELVSAGAPATNGGGGGNLIATIEAHGISKPRAIQLLGLMKDAGGVECCECGHEMLPTNSGERIEDMEEGEKKPMKKRSKKLIPSATASAACSDDDSLTGSSASQSGMAPSALPRLVVTRCQHLFCRTCFRSKVYSLWPNSVKADDRAECSVCKTTITPAIDAVELGVEEVENALMAMVEGDAATKGKNGKKSKNAARLFEHSTKTE